MLTILTFLAILVVLVLIHEFGHYIAAKKNGVFVEEFGFGFPPRAIGKKIGETLYSINFIPLGGFVKLYGEEYHEHEGKKEKPEHPKHRAFVHKSPLQKTVILTAGVIMNFLLGWIIYSYLLVSGIPSAAGIAIEEVQSGSPAQAIGLMKGDQLVKLQHGDTVVQLNVAPDLINSAERFGDKEVALTVLREGSNKTFYITPRKNPPKGQGALGIVITQIIQKKQYPWYQAPVMGFVEAATTTKQIAIELFKIPASLFTQNATPVEFAGPVGIAKIVGEARQYGLNALLQLTALLSLNLAVINILPFPALDGGRLVFVFYEWITGKKSNQNLEKYLNLAGIIILLSLSAIITIADIQKLWG